MELLEGQALAEVLEERGALPITLAVDYALQVCEALASAHAKGIVHGHLQPNNLFRSRNGSGHGSIKVLDFGVSKRGSASVVEAGERRFERTALSAGSAAYMAPEQSRDSGEVDQRADIWSLGCVVFQLFTNTLPFGAPGSLALGPATLEQEPLPLRRVLPEAPPELEAVVARCLAKDPNQRFENVAELARALAPFASERARLYAERCNFLLPAGPGCLDDTGDGTRDSVPALTRHAVTTLGVRRPGRTLSRFGAKLRSGLLVAVALSALGAIYALGRDTAFRAPSARHPDDSTPVLGGPAPANELVPTSVMQSEPDAAAPFAVPAIVPSPVADVPQRPSATAPPRHRAGSQHEPQRARRQHALGRSHDEAFDVGY
jgi:serine/threonine-protein kinase